MQIHVTLLLFSAFLTQATPQPAQKPAEKDPNG